ncbi:hypothetical protein JQC91_05850 [Jannaschia sp. Os4]|uniref:hypothetical protein n=1 Tax=Jannaschia sp. Os4 TaxID=2807617 RepID=UPI00193933C5|nr:hypothetical protein [Jannaschia sp. Os4]MBM2575825.1 hypothetical protein [Jannaschia sp. Os4]
MRPFRDDLARSSDAAWDAVRAALGWPESGWRLRTLARRRTPRMARTVRRATHADGMDVIVRHEPRPRRPARHAAAFAALSRAAGAYAAHPDLALPPPLHHDPDHHATVLGYLPGTPLLDALRRAPDRAEELAVLAEGARWLGVLHGPGEAAPLDGGTATAWVGPEVAPDVAAWLRRAAAEATGTSARVAGLHGDPHLRNLLRRPGGGVAGIDLSGLARGAVGTDLAKLIVHHHAQSRHAPPPEPGAVVPGDALAAACAAHGGIGPEDAGLVLHLRARLARDLWNVGQDIGRWRPEQRRTLRRLGPILAGLVSGG